MQFLIDIALSVLYFCAFLLICAWSWRFWMMYINQKYLASLDWVMLEIKLPREITKSPLATEIAVASLLQSGGIGTKYNRNYKGALPIYSSLEIASIEGVIHFYIRIQTKLRKLVEANFYAQYPEIEIVEADDYTKLIRYHHLSKETSVFGATYRTSKTWEPFDKETGEKYGTKDVPVTLKADFYPLKTYVDYGLDENPKEEFKVDPITPLLETMGGIGKGEYFWYQILIQDEGVYNDKKMPKFYVNPKTHEHLSLTDMLDQRKKQIRTASWVKKGDVYKDEFGQPKIVDVYNDDMVQQSKTETDAAGKVTEKPIKGLAKYLETKAVSKKEIELLPEEKGELEILNDKVAKPLAAVVIRLLYVTKAENFNPGNIQNILSFPKPFNGFNNLGFTVTSPYDFPWEDARGHRVPWRSEEMFEEYVEREGFFPHIKKRAYLDKWEDDFFWASTMKQRKLFRMIYEAIFFPFEHPSAQDTAFTLNLGEVATLWHLPGAVAGTPTLPRIDSTKGMAPVNLPL
jgi:hypothetical protein